MAGTERAHRFTIAVDADTWERVRYWAKRRSLTPNDYAREALFAQLAREAGDYDLPTAEQARLNQLVDVITSQQSSFENLERVVTSGFASLLGLARGDSNYLLDEDGEL